MKATLRSASTFMMPWFMFSSVASSSRWAASSLLR
jgi:hypothetical protein